MARMQPANTQHQKNKRNSIHFVASNLPSLTGAHENKFDNDPIVSALKYHWTHDWFRQRNQEQKQFEAIKHMKISKMRILHCVTLKRKCSFTMKMSCNRQKAKSERPRRAKKNVKRNSAVQRQREKRHWKRSWGSLMHTQREYWLSWRRSWELRRLLNWIKRWIRVSFWWCKHYHSRCTFSPLIFSAMAYANQMKETMQLKITKARNAHSKALEEG